LRKSPGSSFRRCRWQQLGKGVAEKVLASRLISHAKQFAEAILKFFRETISKQWRDFRNQVTDNFRIISDQNIRVLE
jgi:hypothetical protein